MTIEAQPHNKRSNRVAVIDVDGELLFQLAPLSDAGIRVVGSMQGAGKDLVRRIVQGDALPEDCALGALKIVVPLFKSEAYGQQRVTKIDSFKIAGRVLPPADFTI